MKRRWRLWTSALLLGLCGADLAAPEKTRVVVWGLSLGPDSKGDEAAIRTFEERNPDIEIRVLSMGAGGMNPQKLMTAIVGKVPPDVIEGPP